MEIWLLTPEGRKHIHEAETRKSEPEDFIISSLSAGSINTVEEISRRTGLNTGLIETILKSLNEKHWAWKKTTKFTPF